MSNQWNMYLHKQLFMSLWAVAQMSPPLYTRHCPYPNYNSTFRGRIAAQKTISFLFMWTFPSVFRLGAHQRTWRSRFSNSILFLSYLREWVGDFCTYRFKIKVFTALFVGFRFGFRWLNQSVTNYFWHQQHAFKILRPCRLNLSLACVPTRLVYVVYIRVFNTNTPTFKCRESTVGRLRDRPINWTVNPIIVIMII